MEKTLSLNLTIKSCNRFKNSEKRKEKIWGHRKNIGKAENKRIINLHTKRMELRKTDIEKLEKIAVKSYQLNYWR